MRLISLLLCFIGWAGPTSASDPVPIRREVVADERAIADVERQQGPLIRMPRDRFEERVSRAFAAQQRPPARLVESVYRARLIGEQLRGTAAWTIRHSRPGSSLLPVEPWSPALVAAKWSDDRPAIIGKLDASPDATGLDLVVDRSGTQTLQLDWSLQSRREPAGSRFDLRVPACALSHLVLELPIGFEPVLINPGAVVQHPQDGNFQLRAWRIQFGGQTQLSFLVRESTDAPADAAWFTRQANIAHLRPAEGQLTYRLEIDSHLSRRRQVELRLSRGLVPLEVIGFDVERWEILPSIVEGEQRIRVAFNRAIDVTTVTLHAGMIYSLPSPWTCPAVTVVDSVPRGETWSFHVAPELSMEDLRGGVFRLTSAQFQGDGSQQITLASQWARVEGDRPSARLRWAAGDWQASTQIDWRVESDRQTMGAEISITPLRSPLSTVAFTIPNQFDVESMDGTEVGGARWTVQLSRSLRKTVTLNFDQPLQPRVSHRLTIQMQSGQHGDMLTFPAVTPFDGILSESCLHTWVARGLRAEARPAANVHRLPDFVGPSIDELPIDSFRSIGASAEGVLRVHQWTQPIAVIGVGTITQSRTSPHWDYHLRIEPTQGALDAVLLNCSMPKVGPWNWRCENSPARVRSVISLDDLSLASTLVGGCESPLAAFASLAAKATGSRWLVTLDRPMFGPIDLRLTGDVSLTASCRALAALGCTPWSMAALTTQLPSGPFTGIPTWSVANVADQRHEWTVAQGLPESGLTVEGMTDVASVAGRTFRHGESLGHFRLIGLGSTTRTRLGSSNVEVAVTDSQGLNCRYEARVTSIGDSPLRVELPLNAVWRGAKVNGQAVAARQLEPALMELILPMDCAGGKFEMNYELTAPSLHIARSLTVGVPQFQCSNQPPRITWQHSDYQTPVTTGNVASGDSAWLVQTRSIGYLAALLSILAFVGCMTLGWQRGAILAAAIGAFAWLWLPPPLQILAWGWTLTWLVALLSVLGRRFAFRAATLLGVTFAWPSIAGAPAPAVVYILPATSSSVEMSMAPKKLIDQLDFLARRGEPTVALAVLRSQYSGTISESSVQIEARWEVTVFQDNAEFEIPLSGIQLHEIRLNGVEVFPKSTGNNCRVIIPKTGSALVTARLMILPVTDPVHTSFGFDVPEAPIANMEITLPEGTYLIQPTAAQGAIDIQGNKLRANLGRTKKVEIAWQKNGEPSANGSLNIREGYLWDLSSLGATLYGTIRCETQLPGNSTLRVALPGGMELFAVDADEATQLTNWTVHNDSDGRWLAARITKQAKLPAILYLTLLPTEPLVATVPLAFPSASGASDSFLALRSAHGATLRVTGVAQVNDGTFDRDFMRSSWLNNGSIKAYRRLNANAAIRVNSGPEVTWRGQPALKWQLEPRRASVEVTADVSAEPVARSMIEWDVPASVSILSVEGSSIALWTRSGTRLQVWFEKPQSHVSLTWHGQVQRNNPNARFDVPCIRLLGVVPGSILEVTGQPGWELTPAMSQNVQVEPSSIPSWRWVFRCERSYYRAMLQTRKAVAETKYLMNTLVAPGVNGPTGITTIDAQSTSNLSAYRIRARADREQQIELNTQDAIVFEELPTSSGWRTWLVNPNPGQKHRLTMTLSPMRIAGKAWVIPHVDIDDIPPDNIQRTINIAPNLHVRHATGMRKLEGGTWEVLDARWQMTVEPTASEDAPVRLSVTDTHVAFTNDGWRIRTEAWLSHEADAELKLQWADPTKVLEISIDGQSASAPDAPVSELTVPVRGTEAIRHISWSTLHTGTDMPRPATALPLFVTGARNVVPEKSFWSQQLRPNERPVETNGVLGATQATISREQAITRFAGDTAQTTAPSSDKAAELNLVTWDISDRMTQPLISRGFSPTTWRFLGTVFILIVGGLLVCRPSLFSPNR